MENMENFDQELFEILYSNLHTYCKVHAFDENVESEVLYHTISRLVCGFLVNLIMKNPEIDKSEIINDFLNDIKQNMKNILLNIN